MSFQAALKTADERTFSREGHGVRFASKPAEAYPFTVVALEQGAQKFEERLHYSHHTLAKFVTDYAFDNVFEVGSGTGTAARAMKFLGKEVIGIDIQKGLDENQLFGDFTTLKFERKYQALWASHVLEHQRNVGLFLDQCYDALEDGGVLAITVPSALSPMLIGHPSIFTPGHLVYHLVLAGFDCREIAIKQYDWQFGAIVKKKPNNIPRISFASFNDVPPSGRLDDIGYVPNILDFFPPGMEFHPGNIAWGEIEQNNW